jgi:hypothetical protein
MYRLEVVKFNSHSVIEDSVSENTNRNDRLLLLLLPSLSILVVSG